MDLRELSIFDCLILLMMELSCYGAPKYFTDPEDSRRFRGL